MLDGGQQSLRVEGVGAPEMDLEVRGRGEDDAPVHDAARRRLMQPQLPRQKA